MQMKSENHKTGRDIKASYVKAVVKIGNVSRTFCCMMLRNLDFASKFSLMFCEQDVRNFRLILRYDLT
jgi:hypothetical protein